MQESRWFRRAGPGIAALGALGLVASTSLGAPPGSWEPPDCPGTPHVGPAPIGAWYRIDATVADGMRTGRRLTVGRAGDDENRHLDLAAESFAAGPFAGTILIGSDDGRTSRSTLLDVAAGCAWPLVTSTDVVRSATLAPDGATVLEHRVDRRTRTDLGVWRRNLADASEPARILAPIAPDARFGPTWLTHLSWSADTTDLAVVSCGEIACRVRLVDLATGVVRGLADPRVGHVVGVVDDRVVAHGACRGLPCPLLSASLDDGSIVTIDTAAGRATMRTDSRRPVVVFEDDASGRTLRMADPDGRAIAVMRAEGDGRRLIPGPAWADGAVEVAGDWLAVGPDGRLPIDGPDGPLFRHLPDGRTVQLDEVPR
jgi:hypothetical protein